MKLGPRSSWILSLLTSPVLLACPAGGGQDAGHSGASGSESGDTSASTSSETQGDGDGDEQGDGDGDPAGEGVTLEWDNDALELRLSRDGETLLVFEAAGLALGEVAAVDESSSYDPLFVEPEAWRAITSAEVTEDTASHIELALSYEGGLSASLFIDELAEGRFELRLIPAPSPDRAVAMYRLDPRVDAQEGFYGLGELFDKPEHRGELRVLQLEFDYELESQTNEAHVPVPFVTGTKGWGLYVDDDHAMTFDVAQSRDDHLAATIGSGPDGAAGLSFFLFAADHPLDVTRHYYEVSGYPHLPAPWALGPWIWRDENQDQAEVEADIQTLRELDLATSGIWIDRPYAGGVNTFSFDAPRFPDPPGMIAQAHDMGLRVALWHAPYLDADDPAVAPLRMEAEQGGYFPPQTALLTSNWDEPLDLSNSDAVDFWQAQLGGYEDLGIEGYKLDYAEDITVGLNGVRTVWEFADGSSERTMHKHYPRLYHALYQELLPQTGGFLLVRAGTHGSQIHADVVWPGDLDATMTRHKEEFESGGETWVGVGGLPAAVVAGLSLGPSGFPLFASDTGGYRHSSPSPETFQRWFEHSALMPVMQIGTSANDVAWDFEPPVLDSYRELTRLHLRLFPFFWTHVLDVADTGRAIARPLGLAFPELGVHPSFDYMLGDQLLCAPVVDAGAVTREVHFPPGAWFHWFTGERVTNPGDEAMVMDIAAPLGTPPLFLREGAVVPMLRPTLDSLAPTTAPGTAAGEVDSFANDPGRLYVRTSVGPAPGSSFRVYDGTQLMNAGLGAGEGYSLSIAPGDVFTAGVTFEVMGSESVSAVSDAQGSIPQLDADALADAERGWVLIDGVLTIKVGGGDQLVDVEP